MSLFGEIVIYAREQQPITAAQAAALTALLPSSPKTWVSLYSPPESTDSCDPFEWEEEWFNEMPLDQAPLNLVSSHSLSIMRTLKVREPDSIFQDMIQHLTPQTRGAFCPDTVALTLGRYPVCKSHPDRESTAVQISWAKISLNGNGWPEVDLDDAEQAIVNLGSVQKLKHSFEQIVGSAGVLCSWS